MSDAPQLARLDRALRPVRRMVRYAIQPGGRARFVEANLQRHLQSALAVPLPEPLRESLQEIASAVDGYDGVAPEEQHRRMSAVYAGLARLDAVAGLPMVHPSLKPVRKPVQRDQPEAPDAEAPDEPGPSAKPRPWTPPRLVVEPTTPLDDVAPEASASGLRVVADVLALEPVSFRDVSLYEGADPPAEGWLAMRGRLGGSWSRISPTGAVARFSRLESAVTVAVAWAHGVGEPWRREDRPVVVAGDHREGVLHHAEIMPASEGEPRLAEYGVDGVPDAVLRGVVRAWSRYGRPARDPVPAATLSALELPARHDAMIGAHLGRPEARRRMAFDEALLVQLAGFLAGDRTARGSGHSVLHGFASRLGQVCDIHLDDPQQACLEDIKRDLRTGTPMRRVVTGEVGGGRGLVALMGAALVAEGRNQVMVLADDDVAASTRYLYSEPLLREGQITAKLIQSPPTGSQREAIRRGETQVVFGSIELLEQSMEFRRLGLVIVTEREWWGRAGLLCDALPSPRPDLLVVPAVPVGPRLLFTAYAGFDVSLLVDDQRRPARITVCHAGHRARAYGQLREVVAAGRQAVVVFPMVRDRDALDVRGALRLVRALEDELLQGISVGLDHGGMPPDERRRVHRDFAHRRLQVLVSTTRIEEGPRVPGASLVVVEQADSMEAWRLHRIIGFLSRSEARADAILVSGDLATEAAMASLRRLQEAPSGVALTELRVSTDASALTEGVAPMPKLRWLDVESDLELVLAARAEAQRMVRLDPGLRRGAHPELARQLLHAWPTLWPDGEAVQWTAPPLDTGGDPSRKRRRRRRKRR